MKLKTRSSLTMFSMALILTIGLSSLNSGLLIQNSAFAFSEKSINEVREHCGLDKVPRDITVSDVLLQFKQNNAIASEDKIIKLGNIVV